MICPPFVASDLSALRALASQSVGWEAQHALSAGDPVVSSRLTPDLSSVARTVRVQTAERPAEIYLWIVPPRS